jgi:outer membrane lipoprotein-sorting protein
MRLHQVLQYRYLLHLFMLCLLVLFSSSGKVDNGAEVSDILSKLKNQSSGIKSLELTIQIKERIDGEYHTQKSDFKIQSSPFKLYLKEEFPRKGLEVLYVEGMNNGKAWVKPNSFPWTTISLNPLSNTMRSEQHHSLFKSGFSFLIEVLDHLQKKYKDQLNQMAVYNGLVKYNNIICHKLTINNPNFQYVIYTVQEGDNLETLSYKLKVNDYMIKELNPDIDGFDQLEKRQRIKVPNDYGSSFIIYVDKKTNLLVGAKVFDDKGLWEEYTYFDIKVNPALTQKDFDINNPDYNF